jgi:ankyrin repeat protein
VVAASRRGFDAAAVARTLLRFGADVDAASDVGATALIFAAEAGNERLAAVLLRAGADTSRRTARGESAKQLAAARQHGAIFRMIEREERRRAALGAGKT